MNHIVERLLRYGEFDVVVFGDDTILNQPVEEWPLCDCLLCWHSGGYPQRARRWEGLKQRAGAGMAGGRGLQSGACIAACGTVQQQEHDLGPWLPACSRLPHSACSHFTNPPEHPPTRPPLQMASR